MTVTNVGKGFQVIFYGGRIAIRWSKGTLSTTGRPAVGVTFQELVDTHQPGAPIQTSEMIGPMAEMLFCNPDSILSLIRQLKNARARLVAELNPPKRRKAKKKRKGAK